MIENTLILIFRSRSFNYQIIVKGPKIRNDCFGLDKGFGGLIVTDRLVKVEPAFKNEKRVFPHFAIFKTFN